METYKSKNGTIFELIESDMRRFKITFKYKSYFVEIQFGYGLFVEPRIKVNGKVKVMSYQYNPIAYPSLWKNNEIAIDLDNKEKLVIRVLVPTLFAKLRGKGKYRIDYIIGNHSDFVEFDTRSNFIN